MQAGDFHVERMESHVDLLRELRYKKTKSLEFLYCKLDGQKQINPMLPALDSSSWEVMKIGEFWSGRDEYLWLRKKVSIPKEWCGQTVLGRFDFGSTGGGNCYGFEAMLYVNGEIYQAVDSNHMEVFFDIDKLGLDLDLCFRLWSGLEGGGAKRDMHHQIKMARLCVLDVASDEFYYLAKATLGNIKAMDEDSLIKYELQKLMIETMKLIDFTNLYSQEFYASVEKAYKFLDEGLNSFDKNKEVKVSAVGHTHIDLAWLWTIKHSREKASRSFATVLRLMEQYDEYKFLQSTPQLYEYVKNDFPQLYDRIKKAVKEGCWEASGAMWVEADCNISSGESLLRQILYGKKFFREEFGLDSKFLWLPDVFGYSVALPQILKKSGVDTFITTKISWNEINRMPNDTFAWRGLDGTEVLAHFITTPAGYESNHYYTYNGEIDADKIKGLWSNYRNKDLSNELLISYGFGDGGGGVNRDMLENRRALNKQVNLPSIECSFVDDYLEKLHSNVEKNREYLAVWDGELYLEFHRGTYTSQAYNKMMNRKLELEYRRLEILSIMRALSENDLSFYEASRIEKGWKTILRNQFHDILPGSSINEVYEFSKKEYEEAYADALDMQKDFVRDSELDGRLYLYNTQSATKCGYAKLDVDELEVFSAGGGKVPSQSFDGATYFYYENARPFTSLEFNVESFKPSDKASDDFDFNFENKFYKVKWNEAGQIVSLYDKETSREVLKGRGNILCAFEDRPRSFDAWELEATIDLKKDEISDLISAKIISSGECFIVIEFVWKYNKSMISQRVFFYNDSKRIDFVTKVDWQERNVLLKTAFEVDVRAVSARFDTQFGSVLRPTHRNTSWDMAKFELPCQKWIDLSETGFGVAILNDSKYGCDIKDNIMRLSLLKSPTYPDPYADLGEHEFTYSIYPHEQEWYKSGLINEAWDLNAGIFTSAKKLLNDGLLKIDSEQVCIDAIKLSEDGKAVIIRLHEQFGGRCKLNAKLGFANKGYYLANNMEEASGELILSDFLTYELKAFEIVNFRVEL